MLADFIHENFSILELISLHSKNFFEIDGLQS